MESDGTLSKAWDKWVVSDRAGDADRCTADDTFLCGIRKIIRSRPMEAFFPLIVTAIIYVALANVFTFAISILERKVDHKKRRKS